MSRKDFKATNPAAAFLTPAEAPPAQTEPMPSAPPAVYIPPARETRSSRLNLVIKPSTAEQLRKIAAMHQSSVNGIINLVLEDYIEREAATLARYEAVFEGGR